MKKDLPPFLLIVALLLVLFLMGRCETPPKENCEPVTIYVVPNYDSALRHYAPYSNLISDTAIYRTQIQELRTELLAVTVLNGKLRTRLTKAAQDIAGMNQQLEYCKCSPHKPDSIK